MMGGGEEGDTKDVVKEESEHGQFSSSLSSTTKRLRIDHDNVVSGRNNNRKYNEDNILTILEFIELNCHCCESYK
jgi:hypothetical protein